LGYESKLSFRKTYRKTTLVILLTLFLAPVLSQSAFAVIHQTDTGIFDNLIGPPPQGRSFEGFGAGLPEGLIITSGTGTVPSEWEDATIEWEITFLGGPDNEWKYVYWLKGFNMPAVSHFTIEVSDDFCDDQLAITNPKHNGNTNLPGTGMILCEDDMDGIDKALKFDFGVDGDNHYEFTSNRGPLWHHIGIKGGNDLAQNSGINDETSNEEIKFVPTPNGKGTVPPTSIPVGGEFIGIDTTAVLVAGVESTAVWMIPIIISAPGIGIVIARKF